MSYRNQHSKDFSPGRYGEYSNLYSWKLADGMPHLCGYNFRHAIREVRKADGQRLYEVAYYIPGYGVDRIREYRSLSAAKAAITKYDRGITSSAPPKTKRREEPER